MASKFFLHKGKNKRAEQGRPWIYIDEINEYDGDYENGDIVEVYNHKNYFIDSLFTSRCPMKDTGFFVTFVLGIWHFFRTFALWTNRNSDN